MVKGMSREQGGSRAATIGKDLTWIVTLLLLGNLLDALFTLALLQWNLVDEANPIMRWLYDRSPLSFLITKVAAVQVAILLLWFHRHLPAAQLALAAGATLYAGIVAYHLSLIAWLGA